MERFGRRGGVGSSPPPPIEVLEVQGAIADALGTDALSGLTLISPGASIKGDCGKVVTEEVLKSFIGGQVKILEDDGQFRVGKIQGFTREVLTPGGANAYLALSWLLESDLDAKVEIFTDGPFRESVALKLYHEPTNVVIGKPLVLKSPIMCNTVTFFPRGHEEYSEAALFGTTM